MNATPRHAMSGQGASEGQDDGSLARAFPNASPLEQFVLILREELSQAQDAVRALAARLEQVERPPHPDVMLTGGPWASLFFVRFPHSAAMSDLDFANMLYHRAGVAFHYLVCARSRARGAAVIEAYVGSLEYCSLAALSHRLYGLPPGERARGELPLILLANLQRMQDALCVRHAVIAKQARRHAAEAKAGAPPPSVYTYYAVDAATQSVRSGQALLSGCEPSEQHVRYHRELVLLEDS
jgi:hypothetical protein